MIGLRSGCTKFPDHYQDAWLSRSRVSSTLVMRRTGRNPMSFHTHVSRRDVFAGAAGALAFAAADRVAAQGSKPNIVFILADDLGFADVSCYGQRDYTTPNIDRLALGGIRFTQAYSNSPDCSTTRTALITGRYQCRLPVGLG